MLELGVERFDRRGADLLDETIVAVQQFTVIGGIPLVGAAVDVQGVIQEVGLHQAGTAVRTEAADLAVAHLAGRETGHHTVLKPEGRVDVIDRSIGTATSSGGEPHHRRLSQFQHQVDVVNHQIQHH